MIEIKSTARDDLLQIDFTGTVTEKDYTEVLVPALEEAIARQDNIRLLVRFDEGFEDYTLGAVFEFARVGLKHWRGFDRIAVVAEKGWIGRIAHAFSIFMPCPVMVFSLAEYDDARRWLTESLGSIHQTDLGGGVLHVQLLGKLNPAVYAKEERDLDAFIRKHEKFRLLLDLREFDGWQGLGAVAQHVSLVRDHRQFVEKLAIVGTNDFERMAKRLAPLFVNAEVEYFSADGFEGAKRWIKAG
jgi:hypothetical protein